MPRIRVRMYRQGLGDCFLLTITDGGEAHHVLVDCGVAAGHPRRKNEMQAVAATSATTRAAISTWSSSPTSTGTTSRASCRPRTSSRAHDRYRSGSPGPRNRTTSRPSTCAAAAHRPLAIASAAPALAAADRTGRPLYRALGFYGDIGARAPDHAQRPCSGSRTRRRIQHLEPGARSPHSVVRVFVLGPPLRRER